MFQQGIIPAGNPDVRDIRGSPSCLSAAEMSVCPAEPMLLISPFGFRRAKGGLGLGLTLGTVCLAVPWPGLKEGLWDGTVGPFHACGSLGFRALWLLGVGLKFGMLA